MAATLERMQALFSSPGMIFAFAVVLVLEGLSLFALFVIVQIFRSQSQKYRLLLASLGDQSAWGRPGRILVPLYILLTLGATAATTLIFLFQPHIL